MNKISVITSVFAVFSCVNFSQAASIDIVERTLGDGSTVASFWVNPTGSEGTFNTVDVSIDSDVDFLSYDEDGVIGTNPLNETSDATFISALLSAPPAFGGKGFTVLDGSQQMDGVASGPGGLFKSVASLGNNTASESSYLLGNAYLPANEMGTISVLFLDSSGTSVGNFSGTFGIVPEPTTAALGALALAGVLGFRRRS